MYLMSQKRSSGSSDPLIMVCGYKHGFMGRLSESPSWHRPTTLPYLLLGATFEPRCSCSFEADYELYIWRQSSYFPPCTAARWQRLRQQMRPLVVAAAQSGRTTSPPAQP